MPTEKLIDFFVTIQVVSAPVIACGSDQPRHLIASQECYRIRPKFDVYGVCDSGTQLRLAVAALFKFKLQLELE